MFEQLIKNKVRFSGLGLAGMPSAEDIYDLDETLIAKLILKLNELLSKTNDNELSFLKNVKLSKDDQLNKLKFEFLKHVYLSKVSEKDQSANDLIKKAELQEFLAAKHERNKKKLLEMSDSELDAEIAKRS